MAKFAVKISGLDQAFKDFSKYVEGVREGIKEEISIAAHSIEGEAKSRVPIKGGSLAAGIVATKINDLSFTVESRAPYSAYVEFGTGARVFEGSYAFPDEVRQFAKQFYVNGQGQMPAHPFMFPAYYKYTLKMLENVKSIIKNAN